MHPGHLDTDNPQAEPSVSLWLLVLQSYRFLSFISHFLAANAHAPTDVAAYNDKQTKSDTPPAVSELSVLFGNYTQMNKTQQNSLDLCYI